MRAQLAASVAVIVATGCGGSNGLSADAYRVQVRAINDEASKAEDQARATILQARSVDEIVRALTQEARAHDRIGDEVAALMPPEDAKAANQLYVRGSHDLADEIRAVLPPLAAAKSYTDALAFLALIASAQGGKELDTAVSEWKQKGY